MSVDFSKLQSYLEPAGKTTTGRPGGDLVEYARAQATELGVPPEIADRLIRLESGGRADAVSPKGAFGPAQLMPATAKELAAKYGGDPSDPYDNVRLGMHYLRDNYKQFGDWRLAAAAYQAGPGAVSRAGGIPNTTDGITRTSDYVRKVVPAGFGIGGMLPVPGAARTAPAAAAEPPVELQAGPEQDYSEFQRLPTMAQPNTGAWPGIDNAEEVIEQQTADAEAARKAGLTFGDKVAMGAKKGAVQSLGLVGGMGAAMGDALDIESLQQAGMELYERQMKKAQEYSIAPSITDVMEGKADLGDWFAENIGYGAYQVAEALATAGAGALLLKGVAKPTAAAMMKGFIEKEVAGALTAPIEAEARKLLATGMAADVAKMTAARTVAAQMGEQALKEATKKAAQIGGAVLATTANNFRQSMGSIYGEAVENGTVDWEKMLPAAVGATALDSLAEAFIGTRLLGTGAARSGNFATRLAKELPAQMVVQGGTEAGQSAVEQWGAGKEISGKQVIDEAAVGALMGGLGGVAGAVPKAPEERPAPSGMLGRAAEAGQAAGGAPVPVGPDGQPPAAPPPGGAAATPGAVDAIDVRVEQLFGRVQDKALIQSMRADANFGSQSVNDLLSAVAVARNKTLDPLQRTKAAEGAEQLIAAFEGQPNFTMPGTQSEQPAAPGTAVAAPVQTPLSAVAPDQGRAALDGDFTRVAGDLANPVVPPSRRLGPAEIRALPDPEKQRVLREAEAEYEQAFADLLKVEQLGADEAQLQAASIAQQYAEARLSEIQEAIAGGQAAYSAQVRRSVLDQVLADPATANPLERFVSELRRQGFGEATARPDEVARVQRFTDIRDAVPAEPEIEPSAPNEMDAAAVGVRERGAAARPAAPAALPIQQGGTGETPRLAGVGGERASDQQRPSADVLRVDEDGQRAPAGDGIGVDAAGRGGDTGPGQSVPDADVANPALTAPVAEATEADEAKRVDLSIAADLTNKAPTDGQKEAGNYLKGRVQVQGLNVAIENPKGSTRSGKDKDGTEWSVTMPADYGYIERTEGADGDQVDVFIGDLPESGQAWVINQNKADSTKFDEHKVMLGFADEDAAIDAYFGSFSGNYASKLFHSIDGPHTADELRALLPRLKKAKAVKEKMPAGESVPEGSPEGRADLRPEIESLIRMKAAARQIGKEDALQVVIDRAKGYMTGGPLEPGVFIARAKQFKSMPAVQQTIEAIAEKIRSARRPVPGENNAPTEERPGDGGADSAPVESGEQAGSVGDQPSAPDEPEAPAATSGNAPGVADEASGGPGPDDAVAAPAPGEALPNATAPEHIQTGVDDRELAQIVKEFNSAQASMVADGEKITHVFDAPDRKEVIRLNDKAKVFQKDRGWMTVEEAKSEIAKWKASAQAQGSDDKIRSANSQKVVLSLFDLSGEWSKPWEEAGYQVFRFDIQDDPDMGDVNNFSTEFFNDWFGDFDGMEIHAVLAACPCTDFAVSGARHFAAKDKDGRTVASVKLVHQTLRVIEYFRPAVWAVENPVGRIESLGGLPPWRLSFDPNHLGDPYTKKTLIWGRFNADLPIAPVEPTEGSKMHKLYGGKSQATKNARSVTPEGFSYGFFMANNAHDHPAMTLANKFDRLDRGLIEQAVVAGVPVDDIETAVEDFYYMDLDDEAANKAIRELIEGANSSATLTGSAGDQNPIKEEAPAQQGDEAADGPSDQENFSADAVDRAGGTFIPLKELASSGDGASSPWLLPNGRVVATSQDHIGFAEAYLPGAAASYSDFMKATGAVRASFFNDADRGYVATLHLADGQAPTQAQVRTLRSIQTLRGSPIVVMVGFADGMANPEYSETTVAALADGSRQDPAKAERQAPSASTGERQDGDSARRGNFKLKSGESAGVLETAERGLFTVRIGNGNPTSMEAMGSFKMSDVGALSAFKFRANWAEDNVREAADLFKKSQNLNTSPEPVQKGAKSEQVTSANTVFTDDAYAKAREVLRRKLGQLNTGLDPEIIQAGLTVAGYHIEKGARTFAAFAKAVVADMGDTVRPYLKSWYMAVLFDPRAARWVAEMSSVDDVASTDIDLALEGLNSSLNKPSSDGVSVMADLFSDFPERKTLLEQGFDKMDVASKRRVLAQMNARIKDDKILRAIVESIPVDVMNVLVGKEFSANDILSDPSVLRQRLSIPSDAAIPDSVSRFINSVTAAAFGKGAGATAESSPTQGDFRRPTIGAGSATNANDRGHSQSQSNDGNGTSLNYDSRSGSVGAPVLVEHVTGKGKTLLGVVRTDLTQAEAKAIDAFTFKKDGGFFIREKYVNDLPPENKPAAAPEPAPVPDSISEPEENNAAPAPKTRIEPDDIPPAFLRKHMVKTRVYVESERSEVEVELPADQALRLLGEELDRLRAVRACVEG